jgi:hypothetical protein
MAKIAEFSSKIAEFSYYEVGWISAAKQGWNLSIPYS